MKINSLLLSFFLLFLIACNNNKDQQKQASAENPEFENVDEVLKDTVEVKNVTERDYSITKENSYNDLFTDSLALENYISTNKLGDKKIGRRMRSFYNARNYQYAWFSSKGMTEQARFFWNQYDYSVTHLKDSNLTKDDFFKTAENYMNQEKVTVGANDPKIKNAEFGFTEHFIRYINSTYEKGYVKRKEQEKFIPIKKMDPVVMADSILNKKHSDDKYYEQVNDMYGNLKNNLQVYLDAVRTGGFPVIQTAKSIKKGASGSNISLLKKRLQMSRDMPSGDTSGIFNDTLEVAIKKFQKRHGYKQDGILTAVQIKDMNVPAVERLRQILLNMDRMRWLPQKPNGNLIIVNIPEFMLHVFNGKDTVFNMRVVVGKVGNNTMMFNGDLNQVIFSPYWNVPQSIIEKEINPAIARNPGYLESKNMERVGNGIRQRPGPGNALGKVKFIFPNSFNMYFHDTPSKSLFQQDKRAFSHGCIRLAEPQKMAEWLLKDDPNWPTSKIVEAMDAGKEKAVKLKNPVPVFIIYYTAWVDSEGDVNFRDDVYKHDQEVLGNMFVNVKQEKTMDIDNIKTK
jgi:murein L,D-transpeptidase YcbB/YkuD